MISIIMPCYNAEQSVADSVASALNQTFTDIELLAVDDGSTDSTAKVLSDIAAKDSRLRPLSQHNSGPGTARNHGLNEARGDYIAFLDSDDSWSPCCLEKLFAALQASGADLAYCGWQNIGLKGGQGEPFIPQDYSASDTVETILGGCRWPIHAALMHRQAIDSVGGFDESLTSCMDYDLWLRMSPDIKLVLVPEILAYYQHHEGEQITKNRARIAINHWRVQQKFLQANHGVRNRLGRARVRELTYGTLLRRGYACYWKRDLPAARRIFRQVIQGAYGSPADWKYMLPALLPQSVHSALIRMLESKQ